MSASTLEKEMLTLKKLQIAKVKQRARVGVALANYFLRAVVTHNSVTDRQSVLPTVINVRKTDAVSDCE